MNETTLRALLRVVLVAALFACPPASAAVAKGQARRPARAAVNRGRPVKADKAERAPNAGLFIRTELFFGAGRAGEPDVTEAEFRSFLDEHVTPKFPDGLTVLSGRGQFCCDAGGGVVAEGSFVLVLLYPRAARESGGRKIERIRAEYKERFKQQSVLRVDDPRPVRASF
jgi:hypothetical protein